MATAPDIHVNIIASARQTPSIGRVVHYQSYGTPGGEYLPQPRAAIITTVHVDPINGSHDVVGLCVLNPTGMFFNDDVSFADVPTPGCWSWPPRT